MKLYDFRCPNDHLFEALVQDDVREKDCECGQTAKRIISPIRTMFVSGVGHDSAWPTAHDKWVREHERAGMKQESP
jgi:hypothetical protein